MEQFEQLLTCAICLDRYRNPKLLPCQHSFCMEPCMDGLVDYVRRQVKCPECRAEHRIPYQGVQAFPTNVTLQRFLELHIEITGELPDPTSGQTMERCGVCSEKSYCSLCVHCDKKCCPECKDAHMDILRREITRINSQIRRGLHRLQDALALVEKNTSGLQTNCASVAEEVDEIYRRLSKALKDRTEHLRNEVERYSGTELRSLIQLKENLELEIANIQSNCDLADAHINENVPWDDAELLDTKELFLRTVEFIRNFEYEAGDYGRRVRFVMAHDPNQLVLHVAGYGELNIKPETGSTGHLGTTGGLAPPGGPPGLMRSKSDHRLASQYRQQEEERLTRNRYAPDYEYDTPEYETPRNKSRYRSRFMRHRDGEESDGDTRSSVRFTSSTDSNQREKVLDTEDAARGPLSGIFRLTDSPRVMKKLQECERASKRKKDEPPAAVTPTAAPTQTQTPKTQVQPKKNPSVAKQTSEDDEISRIKKQNKNNPTQTETVEERQSVPATPTSVSSPVTRESERETEEVIRRPTIVSRRTSSEAHTPGVRSASSDSSTGSESSTGSGIRSTGATFTAEEMKQKYLSRAPPSSTNTTSNVNSVANPTTNVTSARESAVTTTPSPRPPFQSRFLGAGNRSTPAVPTPAPIVEPKKEEDDDTSSSSEETETETEESETETRSSAPASTERTREVAMARTDIGPLLARSAEARRGSKEESPSTRYSSPRGSPALSTSSPTGMSSPSGYTSRFLNKSRSQAAVTAPREREREPEPEVEPLSPRSRYAALKERRQRVARSRSSHNFGNDDIDLDEDPPSPTTQSPNAYLAAKYGAGSELARSRSTHALKSRDPSPERDRPGMEKDGAALSSWARYLKNKYGNRSTKDKEPTSTSSIPSSSTSAASRRLSLGLPLRHAGQTSFESSDDDQKNPSGSPTSPTAAQGIPAVAGSSTRGQYLLKRRQLLKFGMRGSGAGCFTWPRGLAVGPDNSIVVADSSNHRVQVFDGNGNFIKEFGTYGSGEGEFDCLAGVAVNRIGQFIIADRYNHRIQVLDPSGRFLRAFGSQGTGDGRFNYPWGITTDALGFIYVCDKENHRVQVFQSDGTFVGKFGSCGSGRGQLEHPHYIAVSNTNRVIVSDSNNHRIQIFDVGGRVLTAFGSEGSDDGQFKFPRGVAVDDQGYIIVADSGNNRIQIFTPEGAFLRAFGNWGSGDAEFKGLEGVAVTSAGSIVVCDRENHRVQIF
ncbi:RING finger protein nhl-1 isoform X1 [Microplitis mediator]|uniref:RING finger protein nhl-1 isoform X1 n=1 Tax=Microplitis mediator TaxID=375433 RepID=UPI0025554757|nr:RING finger protein nhl-1 isoform X1 [Microplitis mediator]XP_057336423.1 RING finger protein nhl-1 isoform X1 [Microplitis mediator]